MGVLTLKSRILNMMIRRVGCLSIFSKKKTLAHFHSFLVVLCVFRSVFAFLFYSQPAIQRSDQFKFYVTGLLTLVCSTCKNRCFDGSLILQSLPIFSLKEFPQKARKRMSISIETIY